MLHEEERQKTKQEATADQVELQRLTIKDSHSITVTQTEIQGLIVIQAALQAAIQAVLAIASTKENLNVEQLQRLAQSLETTQFQSQHVAIVDSDEITVTQTELQVEAVVQASIQLLAQLALKIL